MGLKLNTKVLLLITLNCFYNNGKCSMSTLNKRIKIFSNLRNYLSFFRNFLQHLVECSEDWWCHHWILNRLYLKPINCPNFGKLSSFSFLKWDHFRLKSIEFSWTKPRQVFREKTKGVKNDFFVLFVEETIRFHCQFEQTNRNDLWDSNELNKPLLTSNAG